MYSGGQCPTPRPLSLVTLEITFSSVISIASLQAICVFAPSRGLPATDAAAEMLAAAVSAWPKAVLDSTSVCLTPRPAGNAAQSQLWTSGITSVLEAGAAWQADGCIRARSSERCQVLASRGVYLRPFPRQLVGKTFRPRKLPFEFMLNAAAAGGCSRSGLRERTGLAWEHVALKVGALVSGSC